MRGILPVPRVLWYLWYPVETKWVQVDIGAEWITLSGVELMDTLVLLFARSGAAGRVLATMRKVGIVASSWSVPLPWTKRRVLSLGTSVSGCTMHSKRRGSRSHAWVCEHYNRNKWVSWDSRSMKGRAYVYTIWSREIYRWNLWALNCTGRIFSTNRAEACLV